jgi:hypothetical protein
MSEISSLMKTGFHQIIVEWKNILAHNVRLLGNENTVKCLKNIIVRLVQRLK